MGGGEALPERAEVAGGDADGVGVDGLQAADPRALLGQGGEAAQRGVRHARAVGDDQRQGVGVRLVVALGDECRHVEQAAVQASRGDESGRVGRQDGEVAVLLDGTEEEVALPLPGVTEAVRRPFTSVRTVTRSPVIRRTVAPSSATGAAARAGAVGPPGPAATGVTAPADRVSPAATAAAIRMRRLTPVPFVGRVVRHVASSCCSRGPRCRRCCTGSVAGAGRVTVSPWHRWDMSQRRHRRPHLRGNAGAAAGGSRAGVLVRGRVNVW